jgi:integrase
VALSQVQTTPKTDAGRRTVAIPPHIVPEVAEHLDHFVGAAPDAMVFTGEKGGPLRPHVLQKAWTAAKTSTGLEDLHLHDLRHAGNTWAAATGASTKELMARMGHANSTAALRYQHATADRDQAIAAALSALMSPATVTAIAPQANADAR